MNLGVESWSEADSYFTRRHFGTLQIIQVTMQQITHKDLGTGSESKRRSLLRQIDFCQVNAENLNSILSEEVHV